MGPVPGEEYIYIYIYRRIYVRYKYTYRGIEIYEEERGGIVVQSRRLSCELSAR